MICFNSSLRSRPLETGAGAGTGTGAGEGVGARTVETGSGERAGAGAALGAGGGLGGGSTIGVESSNCHGAIKTAVDGKGTIVNDYMTLTFIAGPYLSNPLAKHYKT